jgi:hypothetical protein
VPDFKTRPSHNGTNLPLPSEVAPASHVNSRDGHPLSTTTADGLMAGADKAKLNGLNASDYVPVSTPTFSGDLNTISGTGFRRVNRGDGVSTNTPPQLTGDHPWIYLTQIEHTSGWKTQTARDFNGNSEQVRENVNGTWGAWTQVPFKADKAKLDTLAPPERVYAAPAWTGYYKTFPKGWDTVVTNPPEITIPALGAAPSGFKWLLDVQGAIRLRPDANNNSFFISTSFDRVASTGVDGGGPLFGNLQGALPVTKYGFAPPATDRSFTINFTFWCNTGGSFEVLSGPYPTARCYLVKT